LFQVYQRPAFVRGCWDNVVCGPLTVDRVVFRIPASQRRCCNTNKGMLLPIFSVIKSYHHILQISFI